MPQGAGFESELALKLGKLFASGARNLVAAIERACGAGDCDAALRAARGAASAHTVGSYF
jgi:hypothetical protein